MLTNSQIQEFRTKGFLLGQKILTDEEVDDFLKGFCLCKTKKEIENKISYLLNWANTDTGSRDTELPPNMNSGVLRYAK